MLCAERPKPQKTGSAWMHLATLYRSRSLQVPGGGEGGWLLDIPILTDVSGSGVSTCQQFQDVVGQVAHAEAVGLSPGSSSPTRPGRAVSLGRLGKMIAWGEVVVVRVAGCRRDLRDAVRVRFGDLPSRPTALLHDSEELARRDAGPWDVGRGGSRHSLARTLPCAGKAGRRPMLKRKGIGICTLYAPYASRRHGGRGWLVPVSLCKISGKPGAGERTRTADLLITKKRHANIRRMRVLAQHTSKSQSENSLHTP